MYIKMLTRLNEGKCRYKVAYNVYMYSVYGE
jgi:hypothetical protein